LRLLRDYNFAVANVILFVFGLGMFGSAFLMPLYLQNALGYTALQTGALFLPVGLLQGFCRPSPESSATGSTASSRGRGCAAHRLVAAYEQPAHDRDRTRLAGRDPLRARNRRGLRLYAAGAIALSDIPREKMAQASGLFNVIRQVGGSVGIAVLGSLEARRLVFHSAMAGQAIDAGSPLLRSTLAALQTRAMRAAGSTASQAAVQARSLLIGWVSTRAFVNAVADCFLVAAVVTLIGLIPLLLLRARRRDVEAVEASVASE